MNVPTLSLSIVSSLRQAWRQVLTKLAAVWEWLVSTGITPDLPDWDRKRVRLLNGIAAFSLIIFPLYLLSLWNSPDYVTFWLCFAIMVLTSFVLVLTRLRLYNTAVWYFLLVGTLFYAFDSIAKKNDNTEYTLITYGLAGMMFFRDFRIIIGYFALNVVVFFWVRYAQTVIPPFLYIPEMTDLRNTNTLTSMLAMFAVVYYVKSENRRQEELLAERNEQLQTSLRDLHIAQAQLVQSEKLASLGELTAGIAHEIQNPLNFVNNFADLSRDLLTDLADEHANGTDLALQMELIRDLQANIERIHQHGQRAAGIVRGMLEHSSSSTGQREPTDLNNLCAEYLRLIFNGLPTKGQGMVPCFRVDLDPTLRPVTLVPQDIGRVLSNLYTNAFYAVWQRQQRTPDFQPAVQVRTEQGPTSVSIRVRDNGTGIDPAIQDKIFQPFFTTKPTGQGTGLGLSLSYDIITKGYGGTLTVTSELNAFTEFVITLPS